MVYRGFKMANRGMIFSSRNTWPIFILLAWSVMTAPAFISEPVPTIVSTHPTGNVSQLGSSNFT